jgi:hypothetical protein
MTDTNAAPDVRARNIASNARWRWIFLALSLVVPLVLGTLFQRNNNRLRGLADHGRSATATVTAVPQRAGVTYTEYAYEIDGHTYDWNVGHADAPYEPGETFAITYLPEVPSVSRPGVYSQARFDAEVKLTFQRCVLGVLFGFFALGALACEVGLRRMRRNEPPRGTPWLSPDMAGHGVAIILLAAILAANLDPKVGAKMAEAFGRTPFGLPVMTVVTLFELVLFAPFFWVFPHVVRIVLANQARGGSVSKFGIMMAIANAGPELRRSRAIAIGGGIYIFALMSAWIAYAEYLGI